VGGLDTSEGDEGEGVDCDCSMSDSERALSTWSAVSLIAFAMALALWAAYR